MARVTTGVVPVGRHSTNTADLDVSEDRIRHWVRSFREMKSYGLRVPVPWGHQRKAVPADPEKFRSDADFWNSKYNAGYVEDLGIDSNGVMIATINVPAVDRVDENGCLITRSRLPDGRLVECAIGEVSGAFRKEFRDGQGRRWHDVLTHIALVPHPVVMGQKGFKRADSDLSNGECRLSLSTYQGGTIPLTLLALGSVMDNEQMEPDGGEKGGKSLFPEQDPVGNEPKGSENPEDDGFGNLIELLAKVCNIHLPEGTGEDNFRERLLTILEHENRSGGKPSDGEEGGEGETEGQVPYEENPPTVLSLSSVGDRTGKVLAMRVVNTVRGNLSDRIKNLSKRRDPSGQPYLRPPHVKAMLDEAANMEVQLSVSTGEPVETELSRKVALLEEVLPAPGTATWNLGATAMDHPDVANGDNAAALTEEMVAMVNRKPAANKAKSGRRRF